MPIIVPKTPIKDHKNFFQTSVSTTLIVSWKTVTIAVLMKTLSVCLTATSSVLVSRITLWIEKHYSELEKACKVLIKFHNVWLIVIILFIDSLVWTMFLQICYFTAKIRMNEQIQTNVKTYQCCSMMTMYAGRKSISGEYWWQLFRWWLIQLDEARSQWKNMKHDSISPARQTFLKSIGKLTKLSQSFQWFLNPQLC